MEIEKPIWLDACYVQKVLQKAQKDDSIEVSSMIVKPATAKGDNYASDMHRAKVVLSRVLKGQAITETTSLIAKVAPEGGVREELISNSGFFETEISMMSETLPWMNQILAKLGKPALAARCLHVQHEKPIHLIIEDLAPGGFQMADRQAGLDLDHCLLAIRNLAAFHASSVALFEKDPKAVTKHKMGMFHKDHCEAMVSFFNSGTKSLAEEVAKWPELSPRISEKLLTLAASAYEKGSTAAALQVNDFNVLNHGDFWVNNMLFRYDERRKPIEHIFVDFQLSHYGSPAIDILYFLGTSLSEDVATNCRELLLREYHTSLSSIMAKLKCNTDAPTFDKLEEMLERRALCEVIPSFTVLPMVLIDKSQAKSIDEIMAADGKYENPGYQGKLFRKVMTRVLPLYDSLGLLNV